MPSDPLIFPQTVDILSNLKPICYKRCQGLSIQFCSPCLEELEHKEIYRYLNSPDCPFLYNKCSCQSPERLKNLCSHFYFVFYLLYLLFPTHSVLFSTEKNC